MSLRKLMIILWCATAMSSTAYAFDDEYGPGNPYVYCECDACTEIDSLYQNELDENVRKAQTKVFKASVHNIGNKYSEGINQITSIPDSDKTLYLLNIMGTEAGWPMYHRPGNCQDMILFGKTYTEEELMQNANEIHTIYAFMEEMKAQTKDMTYEQKIRHIHDTVVNKLEYDRSGSDTHKIYDCINSNTAICTGYANLFYLSCINVGIRCECVGNYEHMWNRVWINDEWKYVDCTYNDAARRPKYYLQSESELDGNHQLLECFK